MDCYMDDMASAKARFLERVRKKTKGYSLGKFVDKTGFGFDEDFGGIWFSYDCLSKNFHIAPANTDERKTYYNLLIGNVNSIRQQIKSGIEKRIQAVDREITGLQGRKSECAKGHYYLELKCYGFRHMIGFQTLVCNAEKEVNCYYGQIQFSAFASIRSGPNFDQNGKFKMLYPADENPESAKIDFSTGHMVCNTDYRVKKENEELALYNGTQKTTPDKLVEDFLCFIQAAKIIRRPLLRLF